MTGRVWTVAGVLAWAIILSVLLYGLVIPVALDIVRNGLPGT